jgi:hypothetical protein
MILLLRYLSYSQLFINNTLFTTINTIKNYMNDEIKFTTNPGTFNILRFQGIESYSTVSTYLLPVLLSFTTGHDIIVHI